MIQTALTALRFDPLLPPHLLLALAMVCLLVALLAFWRRARGAVWRALCLLLLLAWLSGPRLTHETQLPLPDIGLLVVDASASMQIGDRPALAEAARAAIEKQAGALPDLQLRTIVVPESGHDGTKLFAAIDQALADIPRARLAGIVAITDGQIHDIPTTPLPAPLHVLLPASGEQIDRRLRIIEAPSYGLVGQSVAVKLIVDDLGSTDTGRTARLTIRRDGEAPHEQDMTVGQETTLDLPVTHAGASIIDLQVDGLPHEISTLNNRAVLTVNGVRDRLRVLLVSGQPHAGERTWRRLLKADPSVDLVHFTILRPPEKDDMTPLNELALIAFPVRELFQDKIKDFDLIILDRFQNRGILPAAYLQNIADYVRDGGALLMSVGPEFAGASSLANTPLASVLPGLPAVSDAVVNGPFRPVVTPLGLRHPVTEDLPALHPNGTANWGEWYRHIQPSNVQGETVMSTPDGTPLLLLDRVDKGRSALLLSDQIWLWSRGHDGGGPQAELLRRVAHWLMKEPELEEEALEASVQDGQLRIERRSTAANPPPPVTITDPDGHSQKLMLHTEAPGRDIATLPATLPGVWSVSDGTHTAYAASVASNPAEIADLRVSADRIAQAARQSGGGVHWLLPHGAPTLRRVDANQTASGSNWIGMRSNHDHIVTGVNSAPLLPSWLMLILLLTLAVAAWRRESE